MVICAVNGSNNVTDLTVASGYLEQNGWKKLSIELNKINMENSDVTKT
ncbi:hypothetical protein OsccyDRAFT_0665 [Leptolyngbyaceae cyanobacterium JSC-12]|nr:hypothetical protein OsccyDRAFT_0665 [Leptolyngbyaceae cyanobacterium JSC-12]